MLKSRNAQSIYRKILDLKNNSPEKYLKIKIKHRENWTQEELETLDKEIKNKGLITNITAFAEELKEKGLFEFRDEKSIREKVYNLKNKSPEEHSKIEGKNGKDLAQEEPKTLDDDLLRELGESLNKYIKNTEQFENIESNSLEEVGEEESEQQLLNNLHKAGLEFKVEYISLLFKSSDTSDEESISRDTCYSLDSSSSEHSM